MNKILDNRQLPVLLLGLALVTKFLLQAWAVHPMYELHRDEFLHVDLGAHLAWGYTSVPPVTGLLSWLMLHLFGRSELWVKVLPTFFGAGTIWLVWLTCRRLGGGLFACALCTTCVLCSVLVRTNTLYQPNSLDIFFWTLLFYCIIRYEQLRQSHYLYTTAVVLGIGFLSKYNILWAGIALLISWLLHRKSILQKPDLYKALLLSLLIVLPNIGWQWSNDWPVVQHLSDLASEHLVHVNAANFLADQLLFFVGGLPVLLAALYALWRYPAFAPHKSFATAFVVLLLLFVLLRAKSYYSIGLYPIYFAFGAVYLEQRLPKLIPRLVLLVLPIVVFVAIAPYLLPIITPADIKADQTKYDQLGITRWEDGELHTLPQDYADMLGWREIAVLTDAAVAQSPDAAATIIIADNYGEAGAANFYAKRSSPEALSFSADYLYWLAEWEKPVRHVVRIFEPGASPNELEKALFKSIILIGKVQNKDARELGASVYLLEEANTDVLPIVQELVQERLN